MLKKMESFKPGLAVALFALLAPGLLNAQTGNVLAPVAGSETGVVVTGNGAVSQTIVRSAGSLPTSEDLRRRMEALKQDAALGEGIRAKALQLYQEALDDLARAGAFTEQALEYEQRIKQAPGMLESIRVELQAPPSPLPPVLTNATLAQLERLLTQAEADLSAGQEKYKELEAEAKTRSDRRGAIPGQIATVKQKLRELADDAPSAPPGAAENPVVTAAAETRDAVARHVLDAELRNLEQETLSYDVRRDLLAARRDRAVRYVTTGEAGAKALREIVNERRRLETEKAAAAARQARPAAARLDPRIRVLADENAALASLRTGEDGLTRRIETAGDDLQRTRELLAGLEQRVSDLKVRVEKVGHTHAVALLLRKELWSLPKLKGFGRRIRDRKVEMGKAQLHLIEFDDQRAALADLDRRTAAIVSAVSPDDAARVGEITAAVRELLASRRELLDVLATEYDRYFRLLVDLDVVERQLAQRTRQLSDFISEHILWVRSHAPVSIGMLVRSAKGVVWAINPQRGRDILEGLADDWTTSRSLFLAIALLILLLVALRPLADRRLRVLAGRVAKIRSDTLLLTIEALFWTVLLAAPLSLSLLGVSLCLINLDQPESFANAVGQGGAIVALILFVLDLLRQMCRPHGVADAHFGWGAPVLLYVRRRLGTLLAVSAPLVVLSALGYWFREGTPAEALGRVSFILLQLLVILCLHRLFQPAGVFVREIAAHSPGSSLARMMRSIHALALVAPAALAALSAMGYHYSAVRMTAWLGSSFCLVAGVVLAEALLNREVRLVARREAFQRRVREWDEKRRRREIGAPEEGAALLEAAPAEGEEGVDYEVVGAQTAKLIRSVRVFTLIFGLWFIWADVIPALRLLDQVVLWKLSGMSEVVTSPADGEATTASALLVPGGVTLADLILSLLVIAMTTVAARHIPGVLELAVLRRFTIGFGERYAITTIVRYVILVIGLIVAFTVIGVGWAKLQWLVAALSVGLGFGLQEIVANFAAGLIILFERPIRVGDIVTVGDISGEVSRIQIRATTVTDWDRKELIIPNKLFVTAQLVNWTLSDSTLRLVIPVGIAYGSDTHKAKATLLAVARAHPAVLKDPPCAAPFVEFGESSLNFELRAFIASAAQFIEVKDELHLAIDEAFRDAGIEIAFPQRDLHIRTAPAALMVRREEG